MSGQPATSLDWVAVAEAVGTWAVAVVAIWGDWIRGLLFKPLLKLRLLSPTGEYVEQFARDSRIGSRYYHLRVSNAKRTLARDVQVLLTSLDIPGPDGAPQRHWTGAVPLTWKHPQLHGLTRDIGLGTEADIDLFFVRADGLQLLPMLIPNNLQSTFLGETHFWVTAIARGLDGASVQLRLKVDWDGHWNRADSEMQKHLTITLSEQSE